MRLTVILLLIAAGLYGVHRLFCWFESRGWMYWTRSSDFSTRAGNAMMEVQSLLEPEKRYVLEMKRDKKALRDDQGDGTGKDDPPEPPASPDPPSR